MARTDSIAAYFPFFSLFTTFAGNLEVIAQRNAEDEGLLLYSFVSAYVCTVHMYPSGKDAVNETEINKYHKSLRDV